MKIFHNIFINISILLFSFFFVGVCSLSYAQQDQLPPADATSLYIDSLRTFAVKDLSEFNLKNPRIRKHLQNLFIDQILLGWILQNKRFLQQKDLRKKTLFKISMPTRILIISEKNNFIGLFNSLKDIKFKAIERIKELDLTAKYYFLFSINIDDNFIINREDLNSYEKKHQIQIQIIDNYILPWIDKYRRFPSTHDFHKNQDGVGIMYKILVTSDNNSTSQKDGIFDSMNDIKNIFYSRLRELGIEDRYIYLTDNDYIKYLLTSTDLNDEQIKTQVQTTFILDRIIPWINKNNRFPDYIDFKVSGEYIGEYFYKIFKPSSHNPALFTNLEELRQLTIQLVQKKGLDKNYPDILNILQSKTLLNTKLKDTSYQDKIDLQKEFIIRYILPWIEQYNRIPELMDFGTEEGKIGVGYTKILSFTHPESALFSSIYDLRKKIFVVFQELNLKELRDSVLEQTLVYEKLTKAELEDPNTRQLLQSICIKEYILPWMKVHGGIFPTVKDFGTRVGQVGISYSKIFGEKTANIQDNKSLFNSMLELKEKTDIMIRQNKLKEYNYSKDDNSSSSKLRPLDYPISQKDLDIKERREAIQRIFMREYLLPWIHNHKGTIPNISNFGTGPDQIGLPYHVVFGGTLDNGETIIGIYDDIEEIKQELIDCITLFIANIDN